MAQPSEELVYPAAQRLAIIAAITGVGGVFDAPILKLFQNDVVPSNLTVLADLTEATFTGYADLNALTWSAPFFDADGSALVLGADHAFIASGSAVGNTIYGWYLTDDPATVLLGSARFDDPVGVSETGQGCSVVPWLRFPPCLNRRATRAGPNGPAL